ncbi:MAG TPA: hypothetical protein VHM19_07005 [Polyangiales bacterium]|nr:hypothetical protein [Polyangiales bacterium]
MRGRAQAGGDAGSARVSRVLVCAALWLLALAGCDHRRETSCRFGAETAVFASRSVALDDAALVRAREVAWLIASDEQGLFVRKLDARSGRPLAAMTRVAERCAGGLDAIEGAQHDVLVACLRPGESRQASAEHALTLYRLNADGALQSLAAFGAAGKRSRGVTLSVLGAQAFIGFQDAIVGEARTWLAIVPLTAAGDATTLRVLSDPSLSGSAPSFAVHGGRVFGAWAETRDDRAGRLVFADLQARAAPVALFATRDPSPSPSLVALEPGGFAVAFRDTRDRRRKTGLYLATIEDGGRVSHAPLRVARADGTGRPALRACLRAGTHELIAATPRTFGGDYFVGAVRVDAALAHVSGEQQFYEDTREFSQVALSCAEAGALLAIAERGKIERGTHAALRAVPLACR